LKGFGYFHGQEGRNVGSSGIAYRYFTCKGFYPSHKKPDNLPPDFCPILDHEAEPEHKPMRFRVLLWIGLSKNMRPLQMSPGFLKVTLGEFFFVQDELLMIVWFEALRHGSVELHSVKCFT
jgi:hypothetical protein